ncbi:hypothetical protein HYV30_00540 [Candidatus Kaiserbacteria bacterium]|nr:hypothetical protein [Candidatus Kaiserbacteria bacterium]
MRGRIGEVTFRREVVIPINDCASVQGAQKEARAQIGAIGAEVRDARVEWREPGVSAPVF